RREVAPALGFRRMGVPRQRRKAGLHVVGVRVAEGSNDGELAHHLRGHRQQFADPNAWNTGGNGPEFAPFGVWSMGLGIPGLLLGMPAVQVKDDYRLGRALARPTLRLVRMPSV